MFDGSNNPSRAREDMFRNSYGDGQKINFHASVTTISGYSFKAREFKYHMKIHLINAVKPIGQIFEFLSCSWDNWA